MKLPNQTDIKTAAQDSTHETFPPPILRHRRRSKLFPTGFGSRIVTRSRPHVTRALTLVRTPAWASKTTIVQFLFFAAGLIVLLPIVSPGIALVMGIAFALAVGNPYLDTTRRCTPILLQVSVVGLGAAMNLVTIATIGMHDAVFTTVSISVTLFLGFALAKLFQTERTTSILLSAGTAICGGSAIAAVASVMRAKESEVSLSLGIVFLLNALALFLFPWIGHRAGFDENQFGLWSALAIHDTSSVIGAASQYGTKALEVATTVKLSRMLWIVPITFLLGVIWMQKHRNEKGQSRTAKPWFILGFLLMASLVTWLPTLMPVGEVISDISKRILVLTLFLIGSCVARASLKNVKLRPFAYGLALWIIVASASFLAISTGWLQQ